MSPVSPCITATTSPRSAAAMRAPHTRFIAASEEGRSLDRCAPTTITGPVRSRSMNARAAVVKCRVSVPCGMRTASAPPFSSFAVSWARCCQFAGFRFSEYKEYTARARTSAISASSGTLDTSSSAVTAGWTAPVR